MKYFERMTVKPNQCGGRPWIRGIPIRVKDILDLLAAGVSEVKILKDLPDLKQEDIRAALEFAAASIDHPVLHTSELRTGDEMLQGRAATRRVMSGRLEEPALSHPEALADRRL